MEDMVVTLSGVIGVGEMEGKTANQLIDLALANWNIPKESVDRPFVTLHNRASNKHRTIEKEEVLGGLDPQNDLVRVILPLKTITVDEKDTKQYLVE